MRLKTLPQAVLEAQKRDPETALNKFMLASLIRDKKISVRDILGKILQK